MRTSGCRVRVLVDTRAAPIQSVEVADLVRAHTTRLYRAGDRVAVLADTMLVQMQLKRVLDASIHRIFIDQKEACAWLMQASVGA